MYQLGRWYSTYKRWLGNRVVALPWPLAKNTDGPDAHTCSAHAWRTKASPLAEKSSLPRTNTNGP